MSDILTTPSLNAGSMRELVRAARQDYRDRPQTSLWEHLLERAGAASATALAEQLSRLLHMQVVLDQRDMPVQRVLPELQVIVLADGLVVCADPWDAPKLQSIEEVLGPVSRWALAGGGWFAAQLQSAAAGTVPPAASSDEVVGFVDRVLQEAFHQGASDIHVEVTREGAVAKLRLDGVLVEHSRLNGLARAEEAVSRIKVLAKLDITERRTPQDGRLSMDVGGRLLDLRVSIMPSIYAEDAVLRLLDKAQLRSTNDEVTLDVLGFEAGSVERLRALTSMPHGMTLVTGPTGSGKTTTVYAVLSEVNTGLEKIITIEDPVEYELTGVLQIPVNERKGLTFAKGLRSILRHDPDRILVGEIRDAETAEIAVQSALTGHQVFTTVHANSIFDVTSRFRHFGLDMFGFMSALNGVVVQRLVRKLCLHCKQEDQARPGTYRAVGCETCRHTGYKGRLVIAEVHAVDDTLRDLVTTQAPVSQLKQHIAKSGVLSLTEVADRYVQAGLTTPEEVRRVIGGSAPHA